MRLHKVSFAILMMSPVWLSFSMHSQHAKFIVDKLIVSHVCSRMKLPTITSDWLYFHMILSPFTADWHHSVVFGCIDAVDI